MSLRKDGSVTLTDNADNYNTLYFSKTEVQYLLEFIKKTQEISE